MQFAAQAREALLPLVDRVLELAGGTTPFGTDLVVDQAAGDNQALLGDSAADLPMRAFFTGILLQVQSMQEEEDVLALFFELSTTAFLGFQYDMEMAEAIDALLAEAEQIAFTMTASDQARH